MLFLQVLLPQDVQVLNFNVVMVHAFQINGAAMILRTPTVTMEVMNKTVVSMLYTGVISLVPPNVKIT